MKTGPSKATMERILMAPTGELLLTDWISHKTPPVREGVYEVDDQDGVEGPWWAYWDGNKFGYREYISPQEAFENRNLRTELPPFATWRGVRRWVLTVPDFLACGRAMVAHVSQRGVVYMTDKLVRPVSSNYPYSAALSFETEADAIAYATKHARRLKGWKVVLP